ncbi:precorrin-4 C(11)-methyltransferase [Kiloniella sp. EL199]|uniref:precorrin-4 C(11)-methyltransferase n=1 Tax=Kiloniella sp. EL199 TaxID=2107581 RepID=UPI000EA3D53C|nr:precorrin-4 C(11)-methyltransferase [Kiloniella sp. EL199]
MTVYFIGAGPGAPDLITIRGRDLIAKCPVCLYAGSLVPEGVIAFAPEDVLIKDTAPMNLDEIIEDISTAHKDGKDVARVHSGDPCLYGSVAEQMRRLDQLGIDYEVVPGVSAYAAASAVIQKELTLPEVSQSIILTRTAMKSSAMPNNEDLDTFGKSGATLAIHLSVRNLKHLQETLIPHYGEDCPVVIAYRVTWPDELIIRCTLKDVREKAREAKITRTALILVGHVLADDKDFIDSKLYDPDFVHVLRLGKDKKKAAVVEREANVPGGLD